MTQVALYTGEALLPLGFRVHVDWYAKVYDFQGTWDSGDIGGLILCKDLRLCLVQLQVPLGSKALQLLYSLGHLSFRVGQNQHVIRKRQEIPPVDHFPQLQCGSQCLLKVNVEEHGREDATLDHSQVG